MPLLNKMVRSGDTFVDWELLLDPQSGSRTVSFGRFAGVVQFSLLSFPYTVILKLKCFFLMCYAQVGAAEALSGLGIAALRHGISTPFLVRSIFLSLFSICLSQELIELLHGSVEFGSALHFSI